MNKNELYKAVLDFYKQNPWESRDEGHDLIEQAYEQFKSEQLPEYVPIKVNVKNAISHQDDFDEEVHVAQHKHYVDESTNARVDEFE